jgi:2-methylcitrate dehydratase PrpD
MKHDEAVMSKGAPAAAILAGFAARLRFDELPRPVVERATHCLIDAVACAIYGARFPWSRIALEQTSLNPSSAFLPVSPLKTPGAVREAALVWGTRAHAFELDSLCKPSAGVHPGATVALPALAMAHALGSSGRDLLRAIVVGCEVMFRIGTSTLHTPEKRGFHAPGLNGPFGAAIACGTLMGLSAVQLANALGIAGSLGGGLLAFSRAQGGGMVKRLHMGRAAEGGVLAAQLAAGGFDGPDTVLDGTFGFLQAVCNESDPTLLTAELGSKWKIESLCLKQFACHITAHAPVHLLRTLMERHGFAGTDIAGMQIGASDKVLSHHTARHPPDLMQAQYSLRYCTAMGAYQDLTDPDNVADDVLGDPRIRRLAEAIQLAPRRGSASGWGVDMSVRLTNGRAFDESIEDFPGCPAMPFSLDRLRTKFRTLARAAGPGVDSLFDWLSGIEMMESSRSLFSAAKEPRV